jgi:hypothetical protein
MPAPEEQDSDTRVADGDWTADSTLDPTTGFEGTPLPDPAVVLQHVVDGLMRRRRRLGGPAGGAGRVRQPAT